MVVGLNPNNKIFFLLTKNPEKEKIFSKKIFSIKSLFRVGFGVGLGYQVGFGFGIRVRVEAETLLMSMWTKSRLVRLTRLPVSMPMPNKITFNETFLLCLSKKNYCCIGNVYR
jgi:hypothetical protein